MMYIISKQFNNSEIKVIDGIMGTPHLLSKMITRTLSDLHKYNRLVKIKWLGSEERISSGTIVGVIIIFE